MISSLEAIDICCWIKETEEEQEEEKIDKEKRREGKGHVGLNGGLPIIIYSCFN